MLLLRDEETLAASLSQVREHTAFTRDVLSGKADLRHEHGRKLVRTLEAAARSPMYEGRLGADLRRRLAAGELTSDRALDEELPELPLLSKRNLSDSGAAAFTRPLHSFLHYYESSGTTGNPAPAPKAIDDLVTNTINIGEMWRRFLQPSDVALILINAPFAPAAYQFEKVLEYLEIMSLRPWVDNITGDYSRVLRLINELGANVFVGPPSRLLEMVQFAHRKGLAPPRFERLLLMAEQTGEAFQQHLSRLTGATPYVAAYGSSETGTIAVTCERRQLHIQVQSYVLELADGDRVRRLSGQNERGELIVTTLDVPSRPLLRYRIGDLVEIDYAGCACGLATPVLRTLGRAQDVLTFSGSGVRQDELEAVLWAADLPAPVVFNYMLVVRERAVVCLVTTDGDPDPAWSAELGARLGRLFGGFSVAVRPVAVLPPLASLGQYLGWKLSRVLDLNDAANWDRLPEPIGGIVRATLATLDD
ncbi:AMP-binding protein [Micromonospora sp. NBC_01699]|uniref:phenylacetate--CoA ligase family protein n=1 Tax=Micromonospora sp. NBC_01699 TaxID=2975984 RepID=UPI002E335983|nr:AMP-binding protein [Micromonospora sp. NBC_01699]